MASDAIEDVLRRERGLLHVVLIGFHHKKGCVVEYAYPPLDSDTSSHGDKRTPALPEEWKFLPSLALPDGAHNFEEDVVYFHLPPRESCNEGTTKGTVYCVSYCRQIDADLLSQKDDQVTRGTVQKSVVILSHVPAFGLIHAKLQLPLIANAFLENFARKEMLKELYNQINVSLNISDESQLLFGLSPRGLLSQFKHKLLIIFKLILLEKRVIFYTSRASELVSGILAIISLFPRMIEIGLSDCTNFHIKNDPLECTVLPDKDAKNQLQRTVLEPDEESTRVDVGSFQFLQTPDHGSSQLQNEPVKEIILGSLNPDETLTKPPLSGQTISRAGNIMSKVAGKFAFLGMSSSAKPEKSEETANPEQTMDYRFDQLDPEKDDDEADMLKLGNARLQMDVGSPEKQLEKPINQQSISVKPTPISVKPPSFKVDEYGFPLSIFTNGHLCLPYISLQHHDIIQQCSKTGFVVGATNVLFQTKKELSDVIVDVENLEITFHDPALQRMLSLSAADLRFAEHIVTHNMQHESEDFFNIATEWMGGDEWLRSLFAEYLHRMLCVVSSDNIDHRKVQDFNEAFVSAWKSTRNFNIWKHGRHKELASDECQHPFHGQYSISDVRLRLHHRLQNSEQGRRIEGAISNANDTIVNTGRYIGSALGSAKSSLTSWISSKVQTNKN